MIIEITQKFQIKTRNGELSVDEISEVTRHKGFADIIKRIPGVTYCMQWDKAKITKVYEDDDGPLM